MKRREFMKLIAGAATWPTSHAQSRTVPVIGVLNSGTASGIWLPLNAAFRQGLSEKGYTDPVNLTLEFRWADDEYDRLAKMAADLIQHRVRVIAAFTTPAAGAAKAATAIIPIVFTTISDPVQIGLVASLNRPGGNLTGMTLQSVELGPKLLELLHEAIPSATRIGLLINPRNPNSNTETKTLQAAAGTLGLQLQTLNASAEGDFDLVFKKLHELRAEALVIVQDGFFTTQLGHLAALSVQQSVPAIYPNREFAQAGGLMSYGTEQRDVYRQVGMYAGRILNGESPADLPVMRPTKFELVINLKTAEGFGLRLPQTLQVAADEVIE